ncbi:4-diphosphocytidyl-2C-methyl-D-erythritol kinase [Neosynechococcus sphagnicola sy1]|uniref:4-diphosphocytidyl-2-C-methyl-D-erythritol kinase n=1 Tax=Neosynechococcus sphagnicola sy1 TaxID=1497020 RepID=A0A098TJU4_9CYAN|nr:4-(cytidine 5'-diphospho)-2-C-methyl-D-erythritol kinase [Neosynechococcus sphagnicola]KGF72566.1 4-diphosphocytidyl-2C-methyl-D-erythritol kinase [Neosynechococcus sphagnicola sy1]
MHPYSLLAAAKINLYLEILGDRPDGYHELIMVMQSVALTDQIDLHPNGTQLFRIHCDHPQVPTDQSNLAYRAAQLMATELPQAFAQFGGVDITIHKQIPVGAGLAGGSANAAAVLVGLDLLWNLGLTRSELQALGAHLGSDVPFCIAGGTLLATGRGEALAPLPDVHLWVVLGKYRSLSVSTAWAYQTYRQQFQSSYVWDLSSLETRRQRVHSGTMINAIAHGDNPQIAQLLHNDLERVVLPAHPSVLQLRKVFQEAGALGTMMSGSGPTVFALATSQTQAQQIQQQVQSVLPDPDLQLWVAPTTSTGIQLLASGTRND